MHRAFDHSWLTFVSQYLFERARSKRFAERAVADAGRVADGDGFVAATSEDHQMAVREFRPSTCPDHSWVGRDLSPRSYLSR